MKSIHKALAICAMTALPIGMATAAQQAVNPSIQDNIKIENAETKTVNLKITGMT